MNPFQIKLLVENLSESQKIQLLTNYNFDPIKVRISLISLVYII